MSAGVFTVVNYQMDSGDIAAVRVQPETLAAVIGGETNSAPTGDRTRTGRVKVSGSKRAYGVHARFVSFVWTADPPDGYGQSSGKIIIPDPDVFAAINQDDTGTYLGSAIRVSGKSPEVVR